MKVTFWGTRGTLPVPGQETVRYGGNTSCVSVTTNAGDLFILDAGTGIRNLGKEIEAQSSRTDATLFLSHSHWDHIQGFPLFAPAYDPAFTLNILGCPPSRSGLHDILARQQEAQVFPVPLDALQAAISIEHYCLDWSTFGAARIRAVPLIHPGGASGFRVEEEGKSVVYMTDNELPEEQDLDWHRFVRYCQGADLLIHDAQYTDDELAAHRGWGHSSISQAVRLALDAGVKRLALFHHDPDRTDDALDGLIESWNGRAEVRQGGLTVFGAAEGITETL
jgi:phosphoribosyl 1,2-cyclic phosphodiesterase